MGSAFLCLYTNAEPWIRLKEPAIAGYAYNPSKPPFEKGGFFVSLRLTSPVFFCKPTAYLTRGECRDSSFR